MDKCIVMGGRGQVGSALASVLGNVNEIHILDVDERPKVDGVDFLHVCIPWSEDFISNVVNAQVDYHPKVTIIHSTVPVGTTRKIGYKSVHSPVRGQHDDLKASLIRFTKYMGGDQSVVESAANHLRNSGIRVAVLGSSEETELAKLLCLSRYLNDLAWYENASRLCEEFGVDRKIVKDWTLSYNEGYGEKYKRPDFDFPDGKVGGHCVIPVSEILFNQTKDGFTGRNLSMFKEGPCR